MHNHTLITQSDLRQFIENAFVKMDFNLADSKQAADVLVSADLRGIDSHGVARLKGYYRLLKADRINPKPNIKIVRTKGGIATFDGDKGLGLVVAPKCMEWVKEKTEIHGSAWVAIGNSNHYGIAAYHAMQVLDKHQIGFSLTNASPLVAPANSAERLLGTNPIGIAIPGGKKQPIIIDMATSTVANGKLEIAQRKDNKIPTGWATDPKGNKSTDAEAVKKGGMLMPLGSDAEHSYHKGYCLSAFVDIMSGVLSGASFGPWVPPFVSFLQPLPNQPGKGIGHFLGSWSIDAFMDISMYNQKIELWIERFGSAKTVKGVKKVLIPGEPEYFTSLKREKEGIPIINKVVEDMNKLAEELGIDKI